MPSPSGTKRYWVEAVTRKGRVIAYGVYDSVNGLVSCHGEFEVTEKQPAMVALQLANTLRDDLNEGIA